MEASVGIAGQEQSIQKWRIGFLYQIAVLPLFKHGMESAYRGDMMKDTPLSLSLKHPIFHQNRSWISTK
jgi:hypothetical protein